MRTVVYVDGYNLYYGLLRNTTLKWLDLVALFRNHVLATGKHSPSIATLRKYVKACGKRLVLQVA